MLEAAVNVVVSILLVAIWNGGSISGTIVSLYFVDFAFKSYYGIKYGLKQSFRLYNMS